MISDIYMLKSEADMDLIKKVFGIAIERYEIIVKYLNEFKKDEQILKGKPDTLKEIN